MSSVSKKRGFTLIELLVVLGIFVIITAVVLARQNKFSSDILLTDTAYQVAISIRQAQVYGISVRGTSGGGLPTGANYDVGYGTHFGGTPPLSSYTFFPDLDESGDNTNQGSVNELTAAGVINYQMNKGKITAVCADDSADKCLGKGGPSYFDVVYIRPNPAAIINSDTNSSRTGSYSKLTITISSLLGDRFKCVNVYTTGQVSVSASPPGASPGNQCLPGSGGIK